MNEFIEKLIKRLEKERHPEICGGWETMKIDRAISIVNQLAEEYKEINIPTIDAGELLGNGWIPCSERLPEEYTEVLGYGIDGHIYMVELYDTKIYGEVWKQWNGGDIRLKFIDAWQPLPQPFARKDD